MVFKIINHVENKEQTITTPLTIEQYFNINFTGNQYYTLEKVAPKLYYIYDTYDGVIAYTIARF